MNVILCDCPFCGAAIVTQCRCPRSDMKCTYGHKWHRCTEHRDHIIEGESNHAKEGCTCRPGHTFTAGLMPVKGVAK